MNFFAELKRRNVFKVAAAYIIVAWLIMQVGEVMAPALHLPDWVDSFLAFILILGFPIALVCSWAFELTSEGLKKEKEVDRDKSITHVTGRKLDFWIIGLLVVALGYFIWESRFGPAPTGAEDGQTAALAETETSPADAGGTATLNPKSIAVIPFQNRSAAEENAAFFADGIHDEVLTNLSKIDDLKVISRTSVMAYRDTTKNMRQIGDELGVATVLEGGVQRAGDQVRINMQLIDAGTDQHLWAEVYNRELTAENVFAIQSEVARAVADALHAALSPQDQARLDEVPTNSLEAYDHFLLARQFVGRQNWDALENALEALRVATQLDPEFQAAWILMAEVYADLVNTGARNLDQVRTHWEAAYDRAATLGDGFGALHAARGNFLAVTGEPGALDALQLALDLDPHNTNIMVDLATLLRIEAQPQEALVLLHQARELDPLSLSLLFGMGRTYAILEEWDKSSEAYARIRAIAPSSATGYGPEAGLHIATGAFDKAMDWLFQALRIDPDDLDLPNWIIRLYIDLGNTAAARAWLAETLPRDPEYAYSLANQAMLDVIDGDLDSAANRAAAYFRQDSPNHRWGSDNIFSNILRMKARQGSDSAEVLALLRDAYPRLFLAAPEVDAKNLTQALDVAGIWQLTGRQEAAESLLNRVIEFTLKPYVIAGDTHIWRKPARAQALTLLGEHDAAMQAIQELVDSGWRLMWEWSIEMNPNFDAIKDREDYRALIAFLREDMTLQHEKIQAMIDAGTIPPPPGESS